MKYFSEIPWDDQGEMISYPDSEVNRHIARIVEGIEAFGGNLDLETGKLELFDLDDPQISSLFITLGDDLIAVISDLNSCAYGIQVLHDLVDASPSTSMLPAAVYFINEHTDLLIHLIPILPVAQAQDLYDIVGQMSDRNYRQIYRQMTQIMSLRSIEVRNNFLAEYNEVLMDEVCNYERDVVHLDLTESIDQDSLDETRKYLVQKLHDFKWMSDILQDIANHEDIYSGQLRDIESRLSTDMVTALLGEYQLSKFAHDDTSSVPSTQIQILLSRYPEIVIDALINPDTLGGLPMFRSPGLLNLLPYSVKFNVMNYRPGNERKYLAEVVRKSLETLRHNCAANRNLGSYFRIVSFLAAEKNVLNGLGRELLKKELELYGLEENVDHLISSWKKAAPAERYTGNINTSYIRITENLEAMRELTRRVNESGNKAVKTLHDTFGICNYAGRYSIEALCDQYANRDKIGKWVIFLATETDTNGALLDDSNHIDSLSNQLRKIGIELRIFEFKKTNFASGRMLNEAVNKYGAGEAAIVNSHGSTEGVTLSEGEYGTKKPISLSRDSLRERALSNLKIFAGERLANSRLLQKDAKVYVIACSAGEVPSHTGAKTLIDLISMTYGNIVEGPDSKTAWHGVTVSMVDGKLDIALKYNPDTQNVRSKEFSQNV